MQWRPRTCSLLFSLQWLKYNLIRVFAQSQKASAPLKAATTGSTAPIFFPSSFPSLLILKVLHSNLRQPSNRAGENSIRPHGTVSLSAHSEMFALSWIVLVSLAMSDMVIYYWLGLLQGKVKALWGSATVSVRLSVWNTSLCLFWIVTPCHKVYRYLILSLQLCHSHMNSCVRANAV